LGGALNGNGDLYGPETYIFNDAIPTGNPVSKAGVNYTYNPTIRPHAVSSTSNNGSYSYDSNGNMTSRTENGTTYTQTFDGENRLTNVTWSTSNSATFVYRCNGKSREENGLANRTGKKK
jgi:YD repeat-containing protein